MSDRLYCTLAQVIGDLKLVGVDDEERALSRIRAASDWIDKKLGQFIPVTETRYYDGTGRLHLWIDPLLSSAPTIIDDGDTLEADDYLLYPRNRHWENGPYTRVTIDPDATTISIWTREHDSVSIAGEWGKYTESVSTGATVSTQQAADATTLAVSDGSLISIGAVLLIGSEQELVTARSGTGTDSTVTLGAEATKDAETLTLSSGEGLYSGEILRVENEQIRLKRVEGTTALVDRAWNETLRVAHASGKKVYVYRTFEVKRAVNGTTAAIHAATTAISKYIPPYDVNWLARQMVGLMIRKAQSGFSGKIASAELEEIFYVDEFPNKIIEKIKKAYRC